MSISLATAQVAHYELEIAIDAPPARVWQALCEELSAWWLPDFHVAGEGSTVSFDPRAGGHLLESLPDGAGLLWYTVQSVVPGEMMILFGQLHADYGGPATTQLKLSLEEQGGKTLLKIRDDMVGRVDEQQLIGQRDGWLLLFTEGLKAHVEA